MAAQQLAAQQVVDAELGAFSQPDMEALVAAMPQTHNLTAQNAHLLLHPEVDIRAALRLAAVVATRAYLYRGDALLPKSQFLSRGGTQAHMAWLPDDETALVAFPGSYSVADWLVTNPTAWLVPAGVPTANGVQPLVHQGFLHAFEEVVPAAPGGDRQSVESLLEPRMGGSGDGKNIVVIGHSLGGAIATLTAEWAARTFPRARVFCYTIGSPRVGDVGFRDAFERDNLTSYRIVNGTDPVPALPPPEFGYRHVKGIIWLEERFRLPVQGLVQGILDLAGSLFTILRNQELRRWIDSWPDHALIFAHAEARRGDFFLQLVTLDFSDHLFTNYYRHLDAAHWGNLTAGGPREPNQARARMEVQALNQRTDVQKNAILVNELNAAVAAQARAVAARGR